MADWTRALISRCQGLHRPDHPEFLPLGYPGSGGSAHTIVRKHQPHIPVWTHPLTLFVHDTPYSAAVNETPPPPPPPFSARGASPSTRRSRPRPSRSHRLTAYLLSGEP